MNINRVTLIGFTGKDARNSSTQNGRSMTKISVATSKHYKDCGWQLAAENPMAQLRCVRTGSWLCGQDPNRCSCLYRRRTRLPRIRAHHRYGRGIAQGAMAGDRNRHRFHFGARSQRKARTGRGCVSSPPSRDKGMRTASVYSVECICGHHIESETNTLICPACERLIVIEWPAVDETVDNAPTVPRPVAA